MLDVFVHKKINDITSIKRAQSSNQSEIPINLDELEQQCAELNTRI